MMGLIFLGFTTFELNWISRATGAESMNDSEATVLTVVDSLNIPYELITIKPEYADTVDFCKQYGYPLDYAGNTIVVASKRSPKKYAACVILATTQLDVNRKLRKLMGVSRLSFASAEQLASLTRMPVGGVTPFTLPEEVPIYVDKRVMDCDWIIVGSGGRSSKIKITPQVFLKLPYVEVVQGLAFERAK